MCAETEDHRRSRLEKQVAINERSAPQNVSDFRTLAAKKRDIRDKSRKRDDRKKLKCWQLINQDLPPTSSSMSEQLNEILEEYSEDLKNFQNEVCKPLNTLICAVCGLPIEGKVYTYGRDNAIFDPLHCSSDPFYISENKGISNTFFSDKNICQTCFQELNRKKVVPKFSKANIPLDNVPQDLLELNEVEQMLVSPILPMVYIHRFHEYGQYCTIGQHVAFLNNVQGIAKKLPRELSEVILNLKNCYGRGTISIDLGKITKALIYLKQNHPGSVDIEICERRFSSIQNQVSSISNNSSKHVSKTVSNITEILHDKLREQGQYQDVENEFANIPFRQTMSMDLTNAKQDIKDTITDLFRSLSNRNVKLYNSEKITSDWKLRFPCLFPKGRGGPDGLLKSVRLRYWVNYVLRVRNRPFHSNILFICFTYKFLRRRIITGLVARKPIVDSLKRTVEQIISMSKLPKREQRLIPETTFKVLASQVSAFVNTLPGTVSDMKNFRKDLFSMITKFGVPTIFLTLSSADSIWPETFLEISDGTITLENVRTLSSKERADMLESNPVRAALSFKRRLEAFMKFIIHGKSKPFGKVLHYAIKSEWQCRLSEHAHVLLWLENSFALNKHFEKNQNSVEVRDAICLAESYCTTIIPTINETFETKVPPSKKQIKKLNIISDPPSNLKDYFASAEPKKHIEQLVKSTQIHTHGQYCLKNGRCKSYFPFNLSKESVISSFISEKGATTHRFKLRRNHPLVNSFSVPLLNIWRANIDVSPICDITLGNVIYLTYYTSKMEQTGNIETVLKKIRNCDSSVDNATKLKKILSVMDTCHIIGAPQAAADLLQFKHWSVSCHIERIDTRSYLAEENKNINTKQEEVEMTSISEILIPYLKDNPNDQTALHQHISLNDSSALTIPRTLQKYFERPTVLFDSIKKRHISGEYISLSNFVENFIVTKRRKCHLNTESLDLKGRVVRCRTQQERNGIIDLSYRVSPPNRTNSKWCAGALCLHVPHRSVLDIFNISSTSSLTNAYEYFFNLKTDDNEPLYPSLHHFERTCIDIENASKQTFTISTKDHLESVSEKCDSQIEDYLDIENSIEEVLDNTGKDSDIKSYYKSWNGNIVTNVFALTNWDKNITSIAVKNIDLNDLIDHKKFMSCIWSKKNESIHIEKTEETELLSYAHGNRKEAANLFKERVLKECKTKCQQEAFELLTKETSAYYYNKSVLSQTTVKRNPIISIVGIPGSGKSWVVSRFRKWASIRFDKDDMPINSSESQLLNCDSENETTQEIANILKCSNLTGKFGKIAVLAFTGVAAGLVKGHTIHSALCLDVNIQKNVRDGYAPLDLSNSTRMKLLKEWSSVKVLIIEEAFMISAELLALINQRICQIFNKNMTSHSQTYRQF